MIRIPFLLKESSLPKYLKNYISLLKSQLGAEYVKTWSQKVGITSRITFKHILNGRKPLNDSQQKRVENALDLGNQERKFLENLNLIEQKHSSDKFYVNSDFFQTPLNTIVLNLCALKKPMKRLDIQNALENIFQPNAIEESISNLLKINLIQEEPDGNFKRIFHGTLTTLPGVKSTSSRDYFKHTYQLAEIGWEFPLHMRELHAFTFKMNSKDIPVAKDLIRKLREDLTELSKKAENDSVFQCSLAAIPIYCEKSKDY